MTELAHAWAGGTPAIMRRATRLCLAAGLVIIPHALPAGPPARSATPRHGEQVRFMWAVAGRESSWDYYARNASSGAFGKYQIMPFNWSAWAGEYIGNAAADQTPRNQERVAYGKIGDLYRWLGSWKRVAYWWLTGRSDRNEQRWSASARDYVSDIMRLRHRAPRDGGPAPPRMSARPKRGDFRRSALKQQLRLGASGPAWARRGRIRDGEVLRVQGVRCGREGGLAGSPGRHWIAVVTVDGRLGWLPQSATVPARRPDGARSWRDIKDRGRGTRQAERRQVRPTPR